MPFKFSSINQNTSSKKSRDRVIGPFVCRDARTVNVVANGIEEGLARSFHARSGLGLCGLARFEAAVSGRPSPVMSPATSSPPCEGGARGGGPVSVECTRGACLARSIDEFDGACAASPALMACRFRSSLGLNGEYTDDAEVFVAHPPCPPFTWGERKSPAFDCATKTMIRDNAKDIAGQSRLQHSCRSGFPARALKVPK